MSNVLEHTAAVLEKMAEYLDSVETERVYFANAENRKVASDILTRFKDLTGDDVSDGLADKIANTDKDVIGLLTKVAGTIQDADSLGGPSERAGTPAGPLTAKEQVKLAEDKFLSWVLT